MRTRAHIMHADKHSLYHTMLQLSAAGCAAVEISQTHLMDLKLIVGSTAFVRLRVGVGAHASVHECLPALDSGDCGWKQSLVCS